MSPEIVGAYYIFNAKNPSAVYLSLDKYTSTECAADKTSVAAIFRYKAGEIDEMSGVPYTQSRGTANKVGDYYYVVDHPQAYCSQIASVQNEVETAFKAFSQSLQTIEAAE
ncbi:hypothetical protein IPL68_07870 [Candidatus Saccharibacteria bacterium]|nr:MAG: hypothetical protein IPL68_07870 [Candidatus Saccharibacteria bacterium]